MTKNASSKPSFKSAEENPHFAGVLDISPEDLSAHKAVVRIIDVRQPEEYNGELGHIPESELMVLGTLPELLPSEDTDLVYVFVCRSGGRSAQAAGYAQTLGFKTVYNMKGGMMLWNDLKLPTAP